MHQVQKVITCDIDGILTDYPNCWLEYLYRECGTRYSSTEEAKIYEKNYSSYKDRYRESEYKANLPINVRNKNALKRLAKEYDIVITTSRPIHEKKYLHLLENTRDWLDNNEIEYRELRYKDDEGYFLDGLDVEFHIDDELEFANIVSRRGKKVYLVASNDIPSEMLEKNVTIKQSITEIMPPFFSVCVPSTNREKTICRALKSVAEQSFRDFELVIVDCSSDDNTVLVIEKFFNSETFISNPFEYTFKKNVYKPKGTEDWNEPLLLASGKYIAMLEGDDYWLSDHLLDAYNAISDNTNIGIYGSSNLNYIRPFNGIYKGRTREYCYIMKEGVVPPSESVFIRCNKSGKSYLYNSDDYDYSPEIALYVDIALDGYDLYYSQKQDVYRETSTNPDKMKTWYYFSNRFVMIETYKSVFGRQISTRAKIYNTILVLTIAINIDDPKKRRDLIEHLSKCVGRIMTLYCLAIVKIRRIYGD